jgi:CRP-like cAMP-binding protein
MVTPEMLSQCGLFEGLSEQHVNIIADIGEETTCQQGAVLFWDGDLAENLYILLEGEINVFVQLSSRPERVTVSIINQPYQPIGWSGILAPHVYSASALCETDCRLVALDGEKLMQVLEDDPALGFVVMRRIAEVLSSRARNTRHALLKTL